MTDINITIEETTPINISVTEGGAGATGPADDINTNITNFDGVLSSADSDVQKALDTLDDVTLESLRIIDNQVAGDIDFNDLGGATNVNYVDFNTGATSDDVVGRVRRNNTERCLEYVSFINGETVVNQIGQETWVRVRNNTGVEISNGKAVYISGVLGNRPTVALARADSINTSKTFIGITTQSIGNNEDGFITTLGNVNTVNTTGTPYGEVWNEGDLLYVSATTAGALTNVRPTAPNFTCFVGIVNVKGTNGTIGVKALTQPILNQLSDVNIDSIVNGQLIGWNGTNLRRENIPYLKYDFANDKVLLGDSVGGNYSEIESDGTYVMNGDATVYDDIFIGFSGARVPPSSAPSWTSFVGNLNQYAFDINDYLEMSGSEIEHSYEQGSDIEIHIHYATNGTDGTDRTVKWEVEYTIANMDVNGNTNSAFASSVVVSAEDTIPAGTADRTYRYLNISNITGTNYKIGAGVIARVRRIASSGTEPTSDPFGIMLGFHIKKNTIGSRTESAK